MSLGTRRLTDEDEMKDYGMLIVHKMRTKWTLVLTYLSTWLSSDR